jgi:hypothetical protein
MKRNYSERTSWLQLHQEVLEELPDDAEAHLRSDPKIGTFMLVHKPGSTLQSAALHVFAGPVVGEGWSTIVLVDVTGTIGRYSEPDKAVAAAAKWASGKPRRRK